MFCSTLNNFGLVNCDISYVFISNFQVANELTHLIETVTFEFMSASKENVPKDMTLWIPSNLIGYTVPLCLDVTQNPYLIQVVPIMYTAKSNLNSPQTASRDNINYFLVNRYLCIETAPLAISYKWCVSILSKFLNTIQLFVLFNYFHFKSIQ